MIVADEYADWYVVFGSSECDFNGSVETYELLSGASWKCILFQLGFECLNIFDCVQYVLLGVFRVFIAGRTEHIYHGFGHRADFIKKNSVKFQEIITTNNASQLANLRSLVSRLV